MAVPKPPRTSMSHALARNSVLTTLVLLVMGTVMPQAQAQAQAQAQTFTVLYNFTDQSGAKPGAGMTMGQDGTLYGTTQYGGLLSCDLGGVVGCGVLFEFAHHGSGWQFTPLFDFHNGPSLPPYPGVPAVGAKGNLYGITNLGGPDFNGTIYKAVHHAGVWRHKVLYEFTGGSDGGNPTRLDPLLFDSSGNIYGAATYGGSANSGVVYELMHPNVHPQEHVLYSFTGGNDGSHLRGITFDSQGNIYGVAAYGGNQDCGYGYGCGTVYKLTHSESGWSETTLHAFQQGVDGGWPGPLIRDKAGNLYGITEGYGPNNNGGTVWELSPSNGVWTFRVLHAFPTTTVNDFGPYPLTLDAAGNLYGITNWGGANNEGLLFKLSPANGTWEYTDLHDFGSDGCYPQGAVVPDAAGNFYGTAESCGIYGAGVIWEFIP